MRERDSGGTMRATIVGVMLLAATATARAEPLQVRNAQEVRVVVAGKAHRAFALKPARDGGWTLELGGLAGVVELFDVTPGTPARTLTLMGSTGPLRLDSVRFVGGHVYRVQLRAGARIASAFVYLHPTQPIKERRRGTGGTERVRFDDSEAASSSSSADEPATIDKGSL